MDVDAYGRQFRRVRIEAAERLALDALRRPETAAQMIGMSRAMLDSIEAGRKRPSFDMMEMMARAYGVLMGDLLPSSTPRGPEADRIIGPLATIPEPHRTVFIKQMSAMARTFASALVTTSQESHLRHVESETPVTGPSYIPQPTKSDELRMYDTPGDADHGDERHRKPQAAEAHDRRPSRKH